MNYKTNEGGDQKRKKISAKEGQIEVMWRRSGC